MTELERLNLIIQEKNKIIASLRAQLEREAATHREFILMMVGGKESDPEPTEDST